MSTTTDSIQTKQSIIESACADYQALKAESAAIDEFNSFYSQKASNSLKVVKLSYSVIDNSVPKTKVIEFSSLNASTLLDAVDAIITNRATELASKVATPINIA